MGQHRRFPGGFLVLAVVLALPTLLYGFVSAAEHADKCAEIVKFKDKASSDKGIKCE